MGPEDWEELSLGHSTARYWELWADARGREQDELITLWTLAAYVGGFPFSPVWDPVEHVGLYANRHSWHQRCRPKHLCKRMQVEWEEIRAAAELGGVEGLVAAWFAGVPVEDLLAGVVFE